MPTIKITSREFNQDVSRAKRAANEGPVLITDRGQPAHVLLSIAEYERMTSAHEQTIESLFSCPKAAEIEFEPEEFNLGLKPADFS